MSIVYFFDKHFLDNIEFALKKLRIEKSIERNDRVAVKLHMGEYGNLNYVRPPIVERIVRLLKELEAKPFLFDTPTMYRGSRFTIEGYYETARRNGFSEETMGCPIIISDEGVEVEINGRCLKKIEVAKELYEADALITISHAKGHAMTGFGGAIKNLGMGGVTRRGKADVHRSDLLRALAEAAFAVLKKFEGKRFFVNVLMDISPLCDCFPLGGKDPGFPVCEDIGILVSRDPVAIDMASIDLINEKSGKNLFFELHGVEPKEVIRNAAKLGLGETKYELKKLINFKTLSIRSIFQAFRENFPSSST